MTGLGTVVEQQGAGTAPSPSSTLSVALTRQPTTGTARATRSQTATRTRSSTGTLTRVASGPGASQAFTPGRRTRSVTASRTVTPSHTRAFSPGPSLAPSPNLSPSLSRSRSQSVATSSRPYPFSSTTPSESRSASCPCQAPNAADLLLVAGRNLRRHHRVPLCTRDLYHWHTAPTRMLAPLQCSGLEWVVRTPWCMWHRKQRAPMSCPAQ